MPRDMLLEGTVWFADQLSQFVAQTVRYIRGKEVSEELPVTWGDNEDVQIDGEGVLVKAHSREMFVRRDRLVLNGEAISPKAGDRVQWIEPIYGDLIEYEVLPTGNDPSDQELDRHEQMWRVPLKQVYALESRSNP